MTGIDSGKLSIGVVSQDSTSLDDAFVSATSDGMMDHGWSNDGSVTLTAESNSMVTVTVHRRGYRPQTKVLRLSSNRLRQRIKLAERTESGQPGQSERGIRRDRRSGQESKHIEDAKASLESIADTPEDPRAVYRQVLLAHQSLCTALGSIDRVVMQESAGGQSVGSQTEALEDDIEALEVYADLLAANLDVLVEACRAISEDRQPSRIDLSASEVEQVRTFVADFRDLPEVGEVAGIDGGPLARFGESVGEWVGDAPETDGKRNRLLEAVERIADELDRVPSHDDVREYGEFDPNTYYDEFGSWADVIEATDIDQRQAFLDDVRSVGRKLGELPTVAEYEVHGEYTASRLKREFGSWGETLDAVESDDGDGKGSSTSRDDLTDGGRRDKMLSLIVDLCDELGRVPKATQLPDDAPFDRQDYVDEFGGWYDAVEASDLDYRGELLQDIRDVATELGHVPDTVEMDDHGRYDHTDAYRFFDTWGEAKAAAFEDAEMPEDESGDDSTDQETTDDEEREVLLSILVDRYDELGRVPKATQLPDDAPFDRQDYVDEFGGWYDAVEASDLDYRGELLQDIRDVATELGHPPDTIEMDDHGRYDHTDAYRFFDTWDEAKEVALKGVALPETTNNSTDQSTDSASDNSTGDNSAERTTAEGKREYMLSIIMDLYDELGRVPKASHLSDDAPVTPQDYVDEFGGWYDAVDATDLDHREEVIQEIKDVAAKLGSPPTTSELSEHGRYDSGDVYRHFDTWREAKEAAGVAESTDEAADDESGDCDEDEKRADEAVESEAERELLEAARRVARKLGRPPSLSDLSRHSRYDLNDVYDHFESWNDLKQLAGAATQAGVEERIDENSDTESTAGDEETAIPPSELTELYEAFFRLSRTVDAVVEATDGATEVSPMIAWRDALNQFVQSGSDGWEKGYGPRQADQSPISVQDYRDTYGDGNHVTDFRAIETASLDPVVETVLDSLDIEEEIRSLRLPVAPDSGAIPPVFVESDREREMAETLLAEFPESPAVTDWEWGTDEEERKSDDGRDASDGDESPAQELLEVSGVTESEAESLCAAGYESVEDLRKATVDEISELAGVSAQLALRIKADVGGK